jgi:hypothetical protein
MTTAELRRLVSLTLRRNREAIADSERRSAEMRAALVRSNAVIDEALDALERVGYTIRRRPKR